MSVKRHSRSDFENIAPRIMDLMYDGSPHSLKVAASLLHRSNEANYSEAEKTLLLMTKAMMDICWPSAAMSWSVDNLSVPSNYYTNLLYSARRGTFDDTSSSDEFLSLVIPSFSLLTNTKSTDFYNKAEVSLKKALSMNPGSAIANYLLGTLRMKQELFKDASVCFAKALESDDGNKDLLAGYIKASTACGDYAAALTLGEMFLSLDSQNLAALKLCCDAYFEKGDYEKAGDYAAKILMLDSTDFHYVLMRAKIAVANKDYVKASSLLDVYSHGQKLSKDYYILRASLQKDWNKNPGAAAETIGKALLAYPNDTDVLLMAAKIASAGGMPVAGKTALEFARNVCSIRPDDTEALEVCITELVKNGSYDQAYALSAPAVKRTWTATLVSAHVDVCLALHKDEEALRLAKQLYTGTPADSEVQKAYLNVLVSTGRKSEAENMIAALMETGDQDMKSFLYYQQSRLYDDETTVLQSLRTSLTMNPRNTDSLYSLYQIYYGKKDWRRAQYYLRQVVALNPSNTKAVAMVKKLDTLMKN